MHDDELELVVSDILLHDDLDEDDEVEQMQHIIDDEEVEIDDVVVNEL